MRNVNSILFIGLMALTGVVGLLSCVKDKVEKPTVIDDGGMVVLDSCGDSVRYSVFVTDLMNQSCATSFCHDAQGNASNANYTLYSTVKDEAELAICRKDKINCQIQLLTNLNVGYFKEKRTINKRKDD